MPKRDEVTGVQYIWVQAAPSLKGKVALWERHPDHPQGEVYVAGDKPRQVARTGEVLRRLSNSMLIEVTAPRGEAAAAERNAPESPAEVERHAEGGSHTAGTPETPTRKGTGAERASQKTS